MTKSIKEELIGLGRNNIHFISPIFDQLAHHRKILDAVEDIGFMTFTEADVVRHPLVRSIVRAYERDSRKRLASRLKGPEISQEIDSE